MKGTNDNGKIGQHLPGGPRAWLSMKRNRIQAAPILSADSDHLETETVILFKRAV